MTRGLSVKDPNRGDGVYSSPHTLRHRVERAQGLALADLHVHSTVSDGMATQRHLVRAAAAAGLAVLCITDHDAIDIPDAIIEFGAELGVEVVRGEEITTAKPSGTHILGLFLEQPIRMGMTIEDTVAAIRDHGGLAVIAHPFMGAYFASMTRARLQRALATTSFDGIELRHTSPGLPGMWRSLDQFYAHNRQGLGAAVGGSDSHFGKHDLGRLLTAFPGKSALDLRTAIGDCTTSPMYGICPPAPSVRLRLAQQYRALVQLQGKRLLGQIGSGAGRLA